MIELDHEQEKAIADLEQAKATAQDKPARAISPAVRKLIRKFAHLLVKPLTLLPEEERALMAELCDALLDELGQPAKQLQVKTVSQQPTGQIQALPQQVAEARVEIIVPSLADPIETASPPSTAPLSPQIVSLIRQSQLAFWRDLPSLLLTRRNRGKWAAYHGGVRIVLAASYTDAYQECFRRGLERGDFYVGKIEAAVGRSAPWEPIESDRSLFEVTDGSPCDVA